MSLFSLLHNNLETGFSYHIFQNVEIQRLCPIESTCGLRRPLAAQSFPFLSHPVKRWIRTWNKRYIRNGRLKVYNRGVSPGILSNRSTNHAHLWNYIISMVLIDFCHIGHIDILIRKSKNFHHVLETPLISLSTWFQTLCIYTVLLVLHTFDKHFHVNEFL
jgi:hypothetical protein